MSYAQAIFESDDFSVAAMGALMATRSVATNKLYYYAIQFAGDTAETLQEGADYFKQTAGGWVVDRAAGFLRNGTGSPLKISVGRDPDTGEVDSYTVVRADGSATPGSYSIDPDTGKVTDNNLVGAPSNVVGYVELHTIEGGALSQVEQEINESSAVIQTFSNLIAANKAAIKSVLNVIR